MVDDASLLRDYAANRSEAAFAELVRRHTNLVYSAALRRCGGDAHRAQEVVQFVFNDLARKPEAVVRHPVLAGWFHTATRNAVFNAARAERRRQFYEQQAALTMGTDDSNVNAEAWVRLRPMLDEVIDGLAHDDRDAVILRYFEERPFAEIGQVLHVSEDAARMRVQRALEKLREALLQRGFGSTTVALGAVLCAHSTVAAPAGFAANVSGVALAGVGAATKLGISGAAGAGMGGMKLTLITGGIAALLAAFLIRPWETREAAPDDRVPAIVGLPAALPNAPANAALAYATAAATTPGATQNPVDANVAGPSAPAPALTPAWAGNRAKITRDYYVLLTNLRLSAEKYEALLTLLVDLRETGADYAAASAGTGVDVTADARKFNRSVKALRAQLNAQIEALLGPADFQRYLAYEEELKEKSYAVVLERKLRDTAAPLTSAQANELTRLVQQRLFDPKGEELLAEAGRFLSAPQLGALRDVQDIKRNGNRNPKVLEAVREQMSRPVGTTAAP